MREANAELQATLAAAQRHIAAETPRTPTMVRFESLHQRVADMERHYIERERQLETMLRGVEDQKDAEARELKRKVL